MFLCYTMFRRSRDAVGMKRVRKMSFDIAKFYFLILHFKRGHNTNRGDIHIFLTVYSPKLGTSCYTFVYQGSKLVIIYSFEGYMESNTGQLWLWNFHCCQFVCKAKPLRKDLALFKGKRLTLPSLSCFPEKRYQKENGETNSYDYIINVVTGYSSSSIFE